MSESFDAFFLGMTVIAENSFYGALWQAGLIGAAGLEERDLHKPHFGDRLKSLRRSNLFWLSV